MDWEQRKQILADNNFVLSGAMYTHKPTNKVFWVLEIKELSDFDFQQLIDCKCIYRQI